MCASARVRIMSDVDMSTTPNSVDLSDSYAAFGCKNIEELDSVFRKEDQNLMRNYSWDYANDNLCTNRIFRVLEHIDLSSITGLDERYWVQHILWTWYHHAISCALWRYGDREKALMYSAKAIEVQPLPHPNKITRLLYYLVRDNLFEAENWVRTITTEPEQSTARDTLELYRRGDFFKVQRGEKN